MSSLFFVAILLTLLAFSHGATQETSDASFSAWLSPSVRQRESMDPFHSFFEFNRRRKNRLRFRRRCRSDPPRTRTFDGYCNNFRHPMKGAAGRPFKLIAPGSQTGQPTGKDRPNPRVLSNLICDEKFKIPSRRRLTDMTTIFGQFIDHTVTETENSDAVWPIPILKNDSTFTTGGIIPFFRTRKEKTPRGWSPLNLLSSYIDAANIYGGNTKNAEQLRTFKDGKMKMGKGNLLPKDDRKFFVSGDKRVNENPALTSLHTLFFREHNRLCDELKRSFPRWNDKKLYHMARKIVGAQMQAVVYYEFIPAVIGHRLRRYWRYRRRIDPAISNEFSTVAFRVGHTMVNSHLTFIGADNKRRQVKLRKAFFNPPLFEKEGLDSILNGLFSTIASEVDVKISGEVRNFLLVNPLSKTHLDLAALNIQRGRDHAIPSYNGMRKAYGLWPVRSFVEVTRDRDLAARLSKAYGGDVNKMDAWIGGLAEDHVWGGSLGPLFKRAWVHEFTRLRDGDRFYFERPRQFPWRVRLRNPTLRALLYGRLRGRVMQHLILKNTNLKPSQVPRNVFRRVSFRPRFRRPRFRRPRFHRPRFRGHRFRRPRFHRRGRW